MQSGDGPKKSIVMKEKWPGQHKKRVSLQDVNKKAVQEGKDKEGKSEATDTGEEKESEEQKERGKEGSSDQNSSFCVVAAAQKDKNALLSPRSKGLAHTVSNMSDDSATDSVCGMASKTASTESLAGTVVPAPGAAVAGGVEDNSASSVSLPALSQPSLTQASADTSHTASIADTPTQSLGGNSTTTDTDDTDDDVVVKSSGAGGTGDDTSDPSGPPSWLTAFDTAGFLEPKRRIGVHVSSQNRRHEKEGGEEKEKEEQSAGSKEEKEVKEEKEEPKPASKQKHKVPDVVKRSVFKARTKEITRNKMG